MKTLFGAALLAVAAGVASADIAATAELVKVLPLGEQTYGTRAVTPGATYSNVTNFSGAGYRNGGTAAISGVLTTRYVSEQINRTNNATPVTRFSFSVANFNAAAVSARARVRFHDLNNSGGTNTGAYIGGFTFNPISFAPGVSVFFADIAATALPQSFSIGITFDNSGTAATLAQMDNLGVGLYNPPDVGTSPDLAFSTTAASVGNVNNGAGSSFNLGGAPVANFGWEIVPAPSSLALVGIGGLAAARRRR
jgi:hypothetical protein